jgi:hypothetical protein
MLDKVNPRSLDLDLSTKKDIQRKVKIITWLLPRFRKGLSDPKQYEALIGRVEQ